MRLFDFENEIFTLLETRHGKVVVALESTNVTTEDSDRIFLLHRIGLGRFDNAREFLARRDERTYQYARMELLGGLDSAYPGRILPLWECADSRERIDQREKTMREYSRKIVTVLEEASRGYIAANVDAFTRLTLQDGSIQHAREVNAADRIRAKAKLLLAQGDEVAGIVSLFGSYHTNIASQMKTDTFSVRRIFLDKHIFTPDTAMSRRVSYGLAPPAESFDWHRALIAAAYYEQHLKDRCNELALHRRSMEFAALFSTKSQLKSFDRITREMGFKNAARQLLADKKQPKNTCV